MTLTAAIFLCLFAAASPPAQATFPGRPGLIVFNLKKFDAGGFTGGLFAIRPGEDQPQQLTSNPEDYDPSFAPSGKSLVFRRVDTSDPGIHILNVRTGATTRITKREDDLNPAFGPKGMVVFSRFVPQSLSYDLILRTGDGRLKQLTSSTDIDEEPVFTPDGQQVIFARRGGSASFDRKKSASEGLYSIRVDGTGLRRLNGVGRRGAYFDVSPDGDRLLFDVLGKVTLDSLESEARSQPLDGGKSRLVSKDAMYSGYSPNGRKIAYSNYKGLWMRTLDGPTSPTLLLGADYLPSREGGSLLIQPAWQPLPSPR